MSIPIQKYRTLAEKLYVSTEDETLQWQINDFSNDLYAALGQYRVVLDTGEDAEGSPYFRVAIIDMMDVEVDWFTDSTISGATPKIESTQSYWVLLSELPTMAYRKAKGADKAL